MRACLKTVSQVALALGLLGCSDDDTPAARTQDAGVSSAPTDAMVADAAPADATLARDAQQAPCTVPVDCPNLTTPFLSAKACCTAAYACGYEVPPPDSETVQLFPDITTFIAQQTKDDPNGRCAPSNLFLGQRPGLDKQRVESEDGGQDILITPDCQSYTVLAFILPGCCLPDSKCGLSTDQSWPTLQVLAEGIQAPFTQPECVSAETLNQQFRDSGKLTSFARTTASGMCNYTALAAELPDTQ